MRTYISMLRGINVSGHNKISMTDLKKLYESIGLANVKTYVQSGNVVFEGNPKDNSILSPLIEAQIMKTFGYDVPVIIRSVEYFKRVINNNPFLKDRNEDTSKLAVTFLYTPQSSDQISKLDHS